MFGHCGFDEHARRGSQIDLEVEKMCAVVFYMYIIYMYVV